jgi:ABC-type phosphate/phosphonate transport system substrate-binding protein
MLGAEMEILATYVSDTTGQTTYHSYFVARREDLPANPTPADVVSFVTTAAERVRFTYHSLFSTSSFFLPSLHFRANGVFHMAESTESLAAIEVNQAEVNSSSHLVRAVARGEADLAAVWDGTRARFADDDAIARTVEFVRLPSAIPNDLLVCSRSAPAELKEKIRAAIRAMPDDEIAIGDFARWIEIGDAPECVKGAVRRPEQQPWWRPPATRSVCREPSSRSSTKISTSTSMRSGRLTRSTMVRRA